MTPSLLALLVLASTPQAGPAPQRSLGPDVTIHAAFPSKFLSKPAPR